MTRRDTLPKVVRAASSCVLALLLAVTAATAILLALTAAAALLVPSPGSR